MAAYSYQLFPELASYDQGEQLRKTFHLCDAQIQLMENVYIRLRLHDRKNREDYVNRGWINLFLRWANAPAFRLTWGMTISTYSDGFQAFCEEALDLSYTIIWRPGREDEPTLKPDAQHSCNRQDNDEIWVAEMCIDLHGKTQAFPVGLALVRREREGSPCVVAFLLP